MTVTKSRWLLDATWLIGIDPGVNNGFFSLQDDEAECLTLDFWDLIIRIDDAKEWKYNFDETIFIIENPNLNPPTFHRFGQSKSQMLKIAQNVGMNKAYATLIIEYLKRYNFKYVEVKPTTRKWTAEEFKRITGIEKRVSQHVRDAAKLVYGYLETENLKSIVI